ncbi:MAG TPA: hypothetical protein VGO71_15780 [Baekduia sp.]|nr:hypothetical protein [Baekduia sp.]
MSPSEPLDPAQPPVEPVAEPAAAPVIEPTPTVGAADATWSQPAGSALLDGAPAGAPVDPNPEKLVGKAFAGGLVAALILGRLAKRRQR